MAGLPFDDVLQMVMTDEIRDSKTVTAMLKYAACASAGRAEMPGKAGALWRFVDLSPDWTPCDNYFTQALEHAGWEIASAMGRRKSQILYSAGLFGFDFLKYDCCRIQFSARTAGRT